LAARERSHVVSQRYVLYQKTSRLSIPFSNIFQQNFYYFFDAQKAQKG
jgi:hypothetical protein